MKITNVEWRVFEKAMGQFIAKERAKAADAAVADNLVNRVRMEVLTETQRKRFK